MSSTDLQIARSSCTLDVPTISTLLLPTPQRTIRNQVNAILSREPLWDLSVRPHLSQTTHLIRSLRLCHRLLQLREAHSWTQEEYREAIRLSDDNLPIILHESAFTSVIFAQGTDAQRSQWIPRCARMEIVGCYAQTELAHGSNVQGLMTTATYDAVKDELVVDSNGIKGAKWWIGGAGVLANYALVQAILKVPQDAKGQGKEKSLGPHLFIVPIRDLHQHLPLPGVTVGDQGPKAYGGFASLDNGYIKFDNVRIPRENMLMRFSKLDKGGKYTKASHDKISYGSMVALRAGIPENIGWVLGEAVTTAIRYCISRRQFSSPAGGEEIQVIHYASVKHRLYPLLAQSYAFILSGGKFWLMYSAMQDALVTRGDTEMLPEIHSLSTALKVSTTNDATQGMEEARRAMGGHGFSWMSGIGGWWANWTPSQTYEGENYVIAQQTARGLLKHLQRLNKAHAEGKGEAYKLPESSEYLRLLVGGGKGVEKKLKSYKQGDFNEAKEFFLNHENLISLLEHRAAYLVGQLAYEIAASGKEKPWTDYSFKTFHLCRAHAELYLAKTFFSITTTTTTTPPPKPSTLSPSSTPSTP